MPKHPHRHDEAEHGSHHEPHGHGPHHRGPHHHGPHHHGPHHHGPHHHGPHHHGRHRHHLHHWLERDLETLRELARRDRYASTETLIEIAEKWSIAAEVRDHLSWISEKYGDVSAAQALDLADHHFRALAERRFRGLVEREGDDTGLLFPLPPHIHEPLLERNPTATILIPSGHHLPHHLEHSDVRVIEGTRACRKAVAAGEIKLIVFELYRSNGKTLVDGEVGDVLAAVVAMSIELWAQLRPHSHPEDVDFDLSVPIQFV